MSLLKSKLNSVVEVQELISYLNRKNLGVCLIGGAVRDILNNREPKDYDIVICADVDVLGVVYDFICNKEYKINRAGGIKLFYNNIIFDIWSFKGQIGMCNGIYEKKIENLVECCFFNYNSIVYDIGNDYLYSKGYEECINQGYLDLVGSYDVNYKNPLWALNIARAVNILLNNNFVVSDRFREYSVYCFNSYICCYSIILLCYEGHYHLSWTSDCDKKLQYMLSKIDKLNI